MGTNDCETIIWLPFSTNGKGSDTRLIACNKEFVAWFYIPMITLNKKSQSTDQSLVLPLPSFNELTSDHSL